MKTNLEPPFYSATIQAGFPSPAEDFIDRRLDLNEHLIHKPAATFFVRVRGDSMTGVGIFENDILIVDRSLDPRQNSIVVAIVDGEFTVKRFVKKQGKVFLHPENDKYAPIEVQPSQDFQVWGVVTYVIHSLVNLK